MKFLRAHAWLLAAVAVLAVPALASAQQCNLQNPPCPGSCNPGGGCAAPVAIQHATNSPCTGGGAFNLRGTEYQDVCADPLGLGTCATPAAPPLRFWQHNTYGTANSGCEDPLAGGWLANGFADFAIGTENGHWFMFQGNWLAPKLQGCISAANGPLRTVAEISFPNTPTEGTAGHASWFLIATVDQDSNGYDFDRITGGTGAACAAGEVVVEVVSPVTIAGITNCASGAPPVQGTANANSSFFNVTVNLTNPNPSWYSDQGRNNAATPLIAGFQIVYATGAAPTSSNYFTGGWTPARDAVNPTQAAGVVALGTASTTVALPATAGMNFWLAARIIYQDTSLNPTGTFDPATPGPLVASDVGSHCGPVIAPTGGPVLAVEFASVSATRTASGVKVNWMTLSEDDTNFFKVFRSTDPTGTEGVVEAVSFVDAQGAYRPYEATDVSVASDTATTYYYYVQEITSQGFGSRSSSVKVEGTSTAGSVTGSGASGARRR